LEKTLTANGITVGELPGKSVVPYRGSDSAKRRIVVCGVIIGDGK